MNPTGRITVTTETQTISRFRLYGYGEDARVPNEGDLLLISESYLSEAGKVEKVELELLLRGKDLWMFSEKLASAMALYEVNKDWLRQPATKQVTPARRAVAYLEERRPRVPLSDPPRLTGSHADPEVRNR